MKTIYEINGKPLKQEMSFWAIFNEYELFCANDAFASLGPMGYFSGLDWVKARSKDGVWTFKRGKSGRTIVVRNADSDEQIAMFTYSYDGGVLELRDGRKHQWIGKREFPIKWKGDLEFSIDSGPEFVTYVGKWMNEQGQELLHLMRMLVPDESKFLGMKTLKNVELIKIMPDAVQVLSKKELTLLAVLGWYIVIYLYSQLESS